MAALEKIRKKAVFLTIVIGVALLAFILGDFLNSGRSFFGDGNTIAKVGSEKIDGIQLQKRTEEVNNQLQKNNQTMDAAVVQNRVLDQMIQEILLDKEFDKAGIYVTDNELSEYMTGKNARPEMYQFAQQCGVESPAQLYDVIFNPTKYGAQPQQVAEMKNQWLKMEKDIERSIKAQKLQGLLAGAIQSNDLDKKQLFEENATTASVTYAKQDYSSLKDSNYPVTDAELQAEQNKEKELYRLDEEARVAHIIAVDVAPSKKDLAAANALIADVLNKLRTSPGADGVRNNSELNINETVVRLSDVNDAKMKEFMKGATAGSVSEPEFMSNTYSIIKVKDVKMESDSVNINMVAVQGDKKLQESILGQLNAGKSISELSKANKSINGQENQWQVIMNLPDSIKSKVLAAGADYFALQSSPQGAYLVKVLKKTAPKAIYNIAAISYKVYPSKQTVDGLRDNLQAFINKNNTSTLLESKGVTAGYQPQRVVVMKNDPQVNNIESTRKVVKWLFDASKGSVSPIFDKENNNKMIVIALDDVYDGGYWPISDPMVRETLTQKVRNSKKGDALMSKLNGKASSVAGYAQLMKSKVDTTQITFGQAFVPGINAMESALIARASVAPVGKIQKLVKGNSAVFAYTVTKQQRTNRKPEQTELTRTFDASRGNAAVMQHAIEILKKATKVENKLSKFF